MLSDDAWRRRTITLPLLSTELCPFVKSIALLTFLTELCPFYKIFHVCSITLKFSEVLSQKIIQIWSMSRGCGEMKYQNSPHFYTPGIRSMLWGYNVFVFSVCVCVCVCVSVNNFRVRSITLKPLNIFSWNFTQTMNTMRRRAEHMNRNSGFSTFEVIALCVLTI